MLKVKDIDAAYGDVQVLWEVGFTVGEGELIALLGANGAGKTTTLNTVSGLLHPLKGEIEFSGHNITRIPGYKIPALGIAHVPEGRRLFPEMTVIENLEIGSLSPPARQKRKETLEWVFTLFPVLKEKQNQLAGTLSGGQQQMVAIGRGLMALPRMIMFDEPSLGLAPVLVNHMFQLIKDINHQGITVLLVEQNVMQVLEICHRAYVIENGRIVLSGTSAELLNNKYIKDVYLGV